MIFSLQRRCTGCRVPFSDPRCFLLVTVYGTSHAHLVHMCWPLLWGLHQMGNNFATCSTYTLGGATQVDHESVQLSRLEPVVVASPKSLHLCSVCLHQWRVPQCALKYPCNPPPPLEGEGPYGLCHGGHMVAKYPLLHDPGGGDRHLVTVSPSRGGGASCATWGVLNGGAYMSQMVPVPRVQLVKTSFKAQQHISAWRRTPGNWFFFFSPNVCDRPFPSNMCATDVFH